MNIKSEIEIKKEELVPEDYFSQNFQDRSLELVESMKKEQSMIIDKLRQQLHDQFDSSVQTLYAKMQEEFESKEKNLRECFNIEILELKKSFEKQKDELKGRHFEEIERMRSVYESKEELRQSEIIELRHENEKLKNQIRSVAMAISTSLPESRNALLNFKSSLKNDYHPVEASVHRRNEYNVNPVKKLKDNNSEASSSDKENRPVRQSPNQKRTLDIEAQLLDLDEKIREALSVINPRQNDAKKYLEKMSKLAISDSMIKKNLRVAHTIMKCRRYKYDDEVRTKADIIYKKLKIQNISQDNVRSKKRKKMPAPKLKHSGEGGGIK